MNFHSHEPPDKQPMLTLGPEFRHEGEGKKGEQTLQAAWVERMVLTELEKIDRKLEYISSRVGNSSSHDVLTNSGQLQYGQFQLSDSGGSTPTRQSASIYREVAEKAFSSQNMTDVLKRVRPTRQRGSNSIRSMSKLSFGVQQVKSSRSNRTSGDVSADSFGFRSSLPDSLVVEDCTSIPSSPKRKRKSSGNMVITKASTQQSTRKSTDSELHQLSSYASSRSRRKHRMVDGIVTHVSTDFSVDQQLEYLKKTIESYTSHNRGDKRTAVWTFLEHPFSGKWAHLYSIFVPVFICSSVAASFLQTADGNFIPEDVGTVLSIIVESFFVFELCIRFLACPDHWGFWLNIFNYIDLLSALPLFVRITVSIVSATTESKGDAVLAIIQVSPLLRLLKLTRRFEKFQLLLSAFEIAIEALPVLLYTLFLLALIFSACLYWVEPPENIGSLPTALWLALVTMTTVGYGDIVPESVAGYVVIMLLMVISALYMAIPIGIVGTAFSQVWNDRDRLLLMTRMRDAFAQAGFTPEAINEIVQLFDPDCSGSLDISEFCVMMKVMHISLTPERVIQVFENLDKSGRGLIRVQDLVDGIFPGANMTLTYFKDKEHSETLREDVEEIKQSEAGSPIPNSMVQQDLCQGLDPIRSTSFEKTDQNESDPKGDMHNSDGSVTVLETPSWDLDERRRERVDL